MAYLSLQVGQCGNQLGHTFFDLINNVATDAASKRNAKSADFACEIRSRFFQYDEDDGKNIANAVLLDTEERVITDILSSTKHSSWDYDKSHIKMTAIGSGNNWAMGHNMRGPEFHNFFSDCVRKELEALDSVQGLLVFGSTAGGSGSGLGSYATEVLRDYYPRQSILNISVWPFQKGDVAVQSYNSLFSLASMQKASDGILMLENDWLLKICAQKMKIKNSQIWDLNFVAAQQLANFLLPVSSHAGVNLGLNDQLAFLVPHPQFKLIGLRSVPQEPSASLPFSSYTWPGLMRGLRRMLLYSTVIDEVYGQGNLPSNPTTSPPVSLANLIISRGQDSESADLNLLQKPSLPYASWVPSSSRIKMWTCPNLFLPYERTALLANNSQLPVSCIDYACADAWAKFSKGFFFHHYKNYGLTKEDFEEAVLVVEQIISSYKSLSS